MTSHHWKDTWKKWILRHEFSPKKELPLVWHKKFSVVERKQFSFHFAFESGDYKDQEVIKLIDKAIVDYALTDDEIKNGKNHVEAWERIVAYHKVKSKKSDAEWITWGMFGESLLYVLLGIFFPEVAKMSTKIRIRTATNTEVHGYDCAHYYITSDWRLQLWLGEAKFYGDYKRWISEAFKSIAEHILDDKIKEEFTCLSSNTIEVTEHKEKIESLMMGNLNDVEIIIPVLVTYDSEVVKRHKVDDSAFLAEVQTEFESMWSKFENEWLDVKCKKIDVYLMALPFIEVQKIKEGLVKIKDAHDQ